MWLLPALILPVVLYSCLVLLLRKAWLNAKPPGTNHNGRAKISVVVAFRDEAANLPSLIASLNGQSYPRDMFEVLLVNDNSTDNPLNWLAEENALPTNTRLLNSEGNGKKAALKTGIDAASGTLIATIDADCKPGQFWLSAINRCYQDSGAVMLFGPVTMSRSGNLLTKIQQLDYYSLQVSGAAAAMAGKPVFCSGANLAFERDAYRELEPKLTGTNRASGDDVFALHLFKKAGKKICFINDTNALVTTLPETSWKGFLWQRTRWGGKSLAYRDPETIILASLVFLANLSVAILLLLSIALPQAVAAWAISWLIKSFADHMLLKAGKRFFRVGYSNWLFALYSLVYPLVIVVTAVRGFIFRVKWKGRVT